MKTKITLRGPETIDLTPSWRGIMPALIAALQDGTPDGQEMARTELNRLAGEVDKANARPGPVELAASLRKASRENMERALADIGLGRLSISDAIAENLPGPDDIGLSNPDGMAARAKELGIWAENGGDCDALHKARASAFYHVAGTLGDTDAKQRAGELYDSAIEERNAKLAELAETKSDLAASRGARRNGRKSFDRVTAELAETKSELAALRESFAPWDSATQLAGETAKAYRRGMAARVQTWAEQSAQTASYGRSDSYTAVYHARAAAFYHAADSLDSNEERARLAGEHEAESTAARVRAETTPSYFLVQNTGGDFIAATLCTWSADCPALTVIEQLPPGANGIARVENLNRKGKSHASD